MDFFFFLFFSKKHQQTPPLLCVYNESNDSNETMDFMICDPDIISLRTSALSYWDLQKKKKKLGKYDPVTPTTPEGRDQEEMICVECEEQHGGAGASTVAPQREGFHLKPPRWLGGLHVSVPMLNLDM